jgi:hypothetical protein
MMTPTMGEELIVEREREKTGESSACGVKKGEEERRAEKHCAR